jgi:glutamate--cysteine ligase
MHFLDIFLLHCLLSPSPSDTPAEIEVIAQNQYRVAERGREPGLALRRNGGDVGLRQWGKELLDECGPLAEALDRAGWRKRAPGGAGRGSRRAARSRAHAVRARAARDEARLRRFVHRIRARQVARASARVHREACDDRRG